MKPPPEFDTMPPFGVGTISSWHKAAYGYGPEEVAGKPIVALFSSESPREVGDIVERLPYRFEFDNENKVLCTTFEGRLAFTDLLSSREETRRHILEKAPVAGIWDYSGVTRIDLSSSEVHQMAQMVPFYPLVVPLVAIAPNDYMCGMLRMFQILSAETRSELKISGTREEAYKILGIQGMNFESI